MHLFIYFYYYDFQVTFVCFGFSVCIQTLIDLDEDHQLKSLHPLFFSVQPCQNNLFFFFFHKTVSSSVFFSSYSAICFFFAWVSLNVTTALCVFENKVISCILQLRFHIHKFRILCLYICFLQLFKKKHKNASLTIESH